MKTKPRNFTFEQLKPFIEEYWAKEALGNPAKLGYTALAEYTRTAMNADVHDRDFSRNPEVRDYISRLKSGAVTLPGMPPLRTYKCMSMQTISKVARDYSESVKLIQELDTRCRNNAEEISRLQRAVIEKDRTIDGLTQEITLLKSKPEAGADIPPYKALVSSYRTFFRDYVHQDIAHFLYGSSCNSDEEYTGKVLTKEAMKALIEGPKPEPVPGTAISEQKQADTGNNIRNLADYVRNNA
ncbi:MAG: hypothetical protein IJ088_04785 [Clostridia bacterium]|nr:hypothetical protein [Clostridia bacterium]MBQ9008631.1 hypothetical protein [Clostridia bacterium]